MQTLKNIRMANQQARWARSSSGTPPIILSRLALTVHFLPHRCNNVLYIISPCSLTRSGKELTVHRFSTGKHQQNRHAFLIDRSGRLGPSARRADAPSSLTKGILGSKTRLNRRPETERHLAVALLLYLYFYYPRKMPFANCAPRLDMIHSNTRVSVRFDNAVL